MYYRNVLASFRVLSSRVELNVQNIPLMVFHALLYALNILCLNFSGRIFSFKMSSGR